MPTQKQIDASNLYTALMEEIKVRIAFAELAITGRLFIHSQLVRETAYLQLRLICELIAMSCLVAHGDIKSTQEKRFTKEYDVGKIVDGLEALHADFYPHPIITQFDAAPYGHHTTDITAVRLTARGVLEWADLAGACGRKWVVSI
jgi:hypothetical protein